MGVKSPERWMAVESPTIRILTVIDCRLSDDARDLLRAQGILFQGILAPPIEEEWPGMKGDISS